MRQSLASKTRVRNFDGKQYITDVMKTYMCVVCGFVYDEEQGLPDQNVAPGTRWEDVPDTWTCPDCGASKEEFELIEI